MTTIARSRGSLIKRVILHCSTRAGNTVSTPRHPATLPTGTASYTRRAPGWPAGRVRQTEERPRGTGDTAGQGNAAARSRCRAPQSNLAPSSRRLRQRQRPPVVRVAERRRTGRTGAGGSNADRSAHRDLAGNRALRADPLVGGVDTLLGSRVAHSAP